MSINNPIWGEGYVPAYQMSGMPYVTSSNVALGQTQEITFDYVTKFVTVKNNSAVAGNVISFGFTQNGMIPGNSNFFVLSGSQSLSADVRTSRLYISGTNGLTVPFSVMAGLTGIPVTNFLLVTSSNGFNGVG